ncbi:LacI family DNA-binding transcriptional regulator [Sphaerochaeta sp. PS]|uniref:LacI family DNA-binding transcriptional regulator n=1 Tax=Sphaerochaeta sp. PS TaxID=3076336 RepID=UPI0028A4F882|nr:LacI family DNA-binding transcriptional regulator [Sphaerochaeta sp. PS]MDT4761288.1 LacI family DNA-binding transcriptional regulator [Sphaerochaeta sp. PS]
MKTAGQATIKDVAKLAGVSIATVSRVLNNLGVVNKETERQVLSAVKALHYQRNAVARSLKMNRTKSIGIIVPEISNTFFSEIVEQLEHLLGPLGYALLFCSSENSVEEEKRKLTLLLERNVDALVVIPASDVGSHFSLPALQSTPMVVLDRKIQGLDCDMVLVDNRLGSYDVTCALIREGHTRIGFLGGDVHVHTSVERLQGFLDAMKHYDLPVDPAFVMLGGMSQKAGYALMQEALTKEGCPSAFFLVNDMVHIGATSYLISQASKEICSKMVFSTFDYLFYAPLLRFCHYAAAQPLERIGQEAAQILIRRMAGDMADFPCKVVLEPTIHVLTENGGIVTDSKAKESSYNATRSYTRVFS